MKRYTNLIMVLLFIAGCQPAEASPAPTETLQPSSTPTIKPTATITPTPSTTPTATITPTVTPVAVSDISITEPTLWNLYDGRTEEVYPLVEDTSGRMRLDPDWEVASVEFAYQWWGLGPSRLSHQEIELQDGQYIKDDETIIPQAQIDELVRAVSGLYVTQGYLDSSSHTDDYPSWDIEITGTDGTRVILNSSANSNRARTPWNVFVNGRFYAQYDGVLAGPLSILFDERLDPNLSNNTDWDDNQLTHISISGSYWPGQFTNGFMGLLPIAHSFGYYADAEESSIVGGIQGRNIIGFTGMIRQGTISDLNTIYLEADGERIDCTFELLESEFEYDAVWEFTCPFTDVEAGDEYHYEIFVELATAEGDPVVTEGILTGSWGAERDMLLTSAPEPLLSLLAENEQAASIMEKHLLVMTDYGGSLRLGQPFLNSSAGTALFFGQVDVDGESFRYTLTLPFKIMNGELVYWAAGIQDVEAMLRDILAEPVTWRVLNGNPDTVINLWYSVYDEALIDEGEDSPSIPGGLSERTDICPKDGVLLPAPDTPLRAFAFDQNLDYFRSQFLFNEQGEVVPTDLVFRFWDDDPLIEALLPDIFIPDARDGLASILLENGGAYRNFTVNIDDEVTEHDYYALRDDWAASLPFEVDVDEYETIWHAKEDIGYLLDDSGKIEFFVCEE